MDVMNKTTAATCVHSNTDDRHGGDHVRALSSPAEVRILRTLGKGRAAKAQLVEAKWANGQTKICVEKVFAPGRLTRLIYRVSFQSPFAYQSNRDAILACFYRRRVAAGVLQASSSDASIAAPLYVRFDQPSSAWVLAAEWIDGSGIQPSSVNKRRLRDRWFRRNKTSESPTQIHTLVKTMAELEKTFVKSGLIGSGWQVAPGALVSTANLLRVGSRYTVIDLESGIPAFLVPRYVMSGISNGAMPPFDDIDADRLRTWLDEHAKLLAFRMKPQGLDSLRKDCERLIQHTADWKESELALLRRPWRLFRRSGMSAYQAECIRRWQQDRIIDAPMAEKIASRPSAARWIWFAGLIPVLGVFIAKLLGRRDYRQKAKRFLSDSSYRSGCLQRHRETLRERLLDQNRIGDSNQLNALTVVPHRLMAACLPQSMHRFCCDRNYRRTWFVWLLLLTFSQRYQAWYGQQRIENAIARWLVADRIGDVEATQLREDLRGSEIRSYARGFGMHLMLKTISPLLVPAKLGGLTAFVASGNLWFLLPLIILPLLRFLAAVSNWWSSRRDGIRHAEALWVSLLPTVGSLAFPLQMFIARPSLSVFLMRDAAATFGQRVPIYGGRDSRTEIAVISATDFVIEAMEILASVSARLFGRRSTQSGDANADSAKADSATCERMTFPVYGRTRLGLWIDRHAVRAIRASHSDDKPTNTVLQQAA